MATKIDFHTDPLTLGDLALMQRLERDPRDVAALVALLASRSRQPLDVIYALPADDVNALLSRMTEALKVAQTLTALTMGWDAPATPPPPSPPLHDAAGRRDG